MKILKKLGWVFLFLYLLIAFLPKENLFFLGEKKLQNYNVILNDEKLKDRLILFQIQDSSVYYDGLHVGNIDSIDLFLGIFYNQISMKNAIFSDKLRQFIPKEISNLKIQSTIFFPIRLWINGDGNFGDISGFIDLYKKKIRLVLKPKKEFVSKYSTIMREFKKINNEYIYEKTIK